METSRINRALGIAGLVTHSLLWMSIIGVTVVFPTSVLTVLMAGWFYGLIGMIGLSLIFCMLLAIPFSFSAHASIVLKDDPGCARLRKTNIWLFGSDIALVALGPTAFVFALNAVPILLGNG